MPTALLPHGADERTTTEEQQQKQQLVEVNKFLAFIIVSRYTAAGVPATPCTVRCNAKIIAQSPCADDSHGSGGGAGFQ